jgi:acetyl esterase/lipase
MSGYFKTKIASVIIVMAFFTIGVTKETQTSPNVVLLWPNGAPSARGDSEGDKPTLTIYLPPEANSTGCGMVICPGGAYGHLAVDHEGQQIAKWLNSIGVAGFVLRYRHRNNRGTGYGHPAPLQDAQRAIRMVRSRAKEWDIDPNRIGIIGFSAGGHLAASAGTHFQNNFYELKDSIDLVSCRPDFMILIYPVITLDDSYTHVGSKLNLLGKNPDPALVKSLSNEKQVTSDTPLTFLVHANDDKAVPPENSINFYLALRKAKVPAEMHIYKNGGHGFGLGKESSSASSWPILCADWLRTRGLLDKRNLTNSNPEN